MDRAEIILAEDDRVIRTAISRLLEDGGCKVRTACDGEEALVLYRERRPDLMVLDVMMPKKDGFAVCEDIRRHDPQTPIVFLTQLDGEESELKGFRAGADNYIPKTTPSKVLIARIEAALRARARPVAGEFRFASWRVNPTMRKMTSPGGVSIAISERETALIEWFGLHPGEVFSHDFLLEKFWGPDYEGPDSPLTVAIMRLRGKLGADGAKITSVRACGYAYNPRG